MMYSKGSRVEWKWMGRAIEGTVEDVFEKSVTKTIKGSKITRHGSAEMPAYLVKSISGNLALKLESELAKSIAAKKGKRPSMFGN